MTPEKRLNQLEPLVAEISAQLDRVTAQNRQIVLVVTQLVESVAQQSDTIHFLLREQIQIKTDVAELKTDVAELKTDVSDLKIDISDLKTGQISLSQKVDLILQLLQSGNGR